VCTRPGAVLIAAIEQGHGAIVDWLLDEAKQRQCVQSIYEAVSVQYCLVSLADRDTEWMRRLVHMFDLCENSGLFVTRVHAIAAYGDHLRPFVWAHRHASLIGEQDDKNLACFGRVGKCGSVRVFQWLCQRTSDVDDVGFIQILGMAARRNHRRLLECALSMPARRHVLQETEPFVYAALRTDWMLTTEAIYAGHLELGLWLLDTLALRDTIRPCRFATGWTLLEMVLFSPSTNDALVLETAEAILDLYALNGNDDDDDDDDLYTLDLPGGTLESVLRFSVSRLEWLVARGSLTSAFPELNPGLRHDVEWPGEEDDALWGRHTATLLWLKERDWLPSNLLPVILRKDYLGRHAIDMLRTVFTSPSERRMLQDYLKIQEALGVD